MPVDCIHRRLWQFGGRKAGGNRTRAVILRWMDWESHRGGSEPDLSDGGKRTNVMPLIMVRIFVAVYARNQSWAYGDVSGRLPGVRNGANEATPAGGASGGHIEGRAWRERSHDPRRGARCANEPIGPTGSVAKAAERSQGCHSGSGIARHLPQDRDDRSQAGRTGGPSRSGPAPGLRQTNPNPSGKRARPAAKRTHRGRMKPRRV